MTLLSFLKWIGWLYIGIGAVYNSSKSPLIMGVTLFFAVVFMFKSQRTTIAE